MYVNDLSADSTWPTELAFSATNSSYSGSHLEGRRSSDDFGFSKFHRLLISKCYPGVRDEGGCAGEGGCRLMTIASRVFLPRLRTEVIITMLVSCPCLLYLVHIGTVWISDVKARSIGAYYSSAYFHRPPGRIASLYRSFTFSLSYFLASSRSRSRS